MKIDRKHILFTIILIIILISIAIKVWGYFEIAAMFRSGKAIDKPGSAVSKSPET